MIRVIPVKVSVPANTLASAPVKASIVSPFETLKGFSVWQNCAVVDADKSGFLVRTMGINLYPDYGSGLTPAEDDFSPVPIQPLTVDLDCETLNGPPYSVDILFYNLSAGAVVVNVLLSFQPKPLKKAKKNDDATPSDDTSKNNGE